MQLSESHPQNNNSNKIVSSLNVSYQIWKNFFICLGLGFFAILYFLNFGIIFIIQGTVPQLH